MKMQLIFGRNAYAYSHALDFAGDWHEHYLPVIGFMDGNRRLADELAASYPINCKDGYHPKVKNLRMADGTLDEFTMNGAKAVSATDAAITKAIRSFKPVGKGDCILAVSERMGGSCFSPGRVLTFAWLQLTPNTAHLTNKTLFEFGFYESPYDCTPSKMAMRSFTNYPDAVAHIKNFIPVIECAIQQRANEKAAEEQRVDALRKELRF